MLNSTNQTILHCYPGLIALITAKHEDTQNVMSAGWHSYLSYDPAIYGVAVAKERFTYGLIQKSESFAINFVPAEYAHIIEGAGKLSGADGDKLEKLGLNWTSGETVSSPILAISYVAYECKVIDIQCYGDHDWIVGKITKFHQDADKFGDNGLPDFNNVELPLYLGQSKYLIVDNGTTYKKIEIDYNSKK
ncbi:NADH-FMN oxidoreductase RutF, flavin reductase (DIM6/NTAB) family [Evansella caseinilytica]|uniref:NADH-FMN oxidoreductase RutF, flavin reductase (DIM6/NTAB) family n=1 Tax=Evansella caseinilytica TaxID=1503961 RepID=A0A1H3QGM2_9BACI|nr:flavin reductase family protein [Evansella caseinilytica]SDZ12517.1 NADH-FMN oxidoreductase RutF, flavin reductase (DIM6/NTAB) family [Evansella caseinilytica]